MNISGWVLNLHPILHKLIDKIAHVRLQGEAIFRIFAALLIFLTERFTHMNYLYLWTKHVSKCVKQWLKNKEKTENKDSISVSHTTAAQWSSISKNGIIDFDKKSHF